MGEKEDGAVVEDAQDQGASGGGETPEQGGEVISSPELTEEQIRDLPFVQELQSKYDSVKAEAIERRQQLKDPKVLAERLAKIAQGEPDADQEEGATTQEPDAMPEWARRLESKVDALQGIENSRSVESLVTAHGLTPEQRTIIENPDMPAELRESTAKQFGYLNNLSGSNTDSGNPDAGGSNVDPDVARARAAIKRATFQDDPGAQPGVFSIEGHRRLGGGAVLNPKFSD